MENIVHKLAGFRLNKPEGQVSGLSGLECEPERVLFGMVGRHNGQHVFYFTDAIFNLILLYCYFVNIFMMLLLTHPQIQFIPQHNLPIPLLSISRHNVQNCDIVGNHFELGSQVIEEMLLEFW
jgi:hypothetical protein